MNDYEKQMQIEGRKVCSCIGAVRHLTNCMILGAKDTWGPTDQLT